MKRLFILMLSVVVAFSFSACDKDDDDNGSGASSITVKEEQQAFVLLTTATWCGYCASWGIPTFEGAFNGDDGVDGDRVNGVALHYSDTDPMYHEMAATIKSQFAIGGPPNLWIEFDNTHNLNPGGWVSAIKSRQAENSPDCGIGMNVKQDGNDFTIDVRVKFFNSMSGTYNLAIYISEDGIIANQSGGTADYVHNHTFRGEVTANNAWGVEMFSGSSPSDFTDSFTYTASGSVVADNVSFVAVVYEMDGGVPVSSPNSNTR